MNGLIISAYNNRFPIAVAVATVALASISFKRKERDERDEQPMQQQSMQQQSMQQPMKRFLKNPPTRIEELCDVNSDLNLELSKLQNLIINNLYSSINIPNVFKTVNSNYLTKDMLLPTSTSEESLFFATEETGLNVYIGTPTLSNVNRKFTSSNLNPPTLYDTVLKYNVSPNFFFIYYF